MAATSIPSIGDVLMLSQVAWRTGRAFASGRDTVPREFRQIEAELNGLAKALKRLAETLFADSADALLAQVSKPTQSGIAAIILSCKRALGDLESLIDQYQVIKKNPTAGGYTVERSWSDLVVMNFMHMLWTTEGGTIQELREILRIHTSAVSLTRQALQSNDLERLDYVVHPISEQLQNLYDMRSEEELHEKIEKLRDVVDNVAGRTPTLNAHLERVSSVGSGQGSPRDTFQTPSPLSTHIPTPTITAGGQVSPVGLVPSMRRSLTSQSEDTRTSEGRSSRTPSELSMPRTAGGRANALTITPGSPALAPSAFKTSASETGSLRLPPAALDGDDLDAITPVLPKELSFLPPLGKHPEYLGRSASTRSQQDKFEKAAFKHSAILCDLRCQLIEFTQPGLDDDRAYDVTLEEAMRDCRVCLVRRRELTPDGKSRFTTSVWAVNDDLTIRMQQTLPDDVDVIPYASYFQSEKVSTTIPCDLIFHDITYGTRPLREYRTTWVNYVFEDPRSAAEFQSVLYGRTLLASFKTEKTLRVHEGIAHVIAFQEQMCALETLRLWLDEETSGVIGMIHFSAQFRPGYMLFYLNSAEDPIRIRDEEGKVIKIKGLRIPRSPTERRGSSEAKRFVQGARIEFASRTEKRDFLERVGEVQRHLVDGLPELGC